MHKKTGERDNERNTNNSTTDTSTADALTKKPSGRSTLQVISSIFAGLLGVQSNKNREADFKEGRSSDYIIYGILAVIALLVGMGVMVNYVISSSQ